MNAAHSTESRTADPVLVTMEDNDFCTAQGFEMPDGIHTLAWTIYHTGACGGYAAGTIMWEIVEHGVVRRTVAKGTLQDMDAPAEIVSAVREQAPRFFS